MLVRKAALNAALCAVSETDTRYTLNAVEITPAGRVAGTNGHVLVVAYEDTPIAAEDYPALPAVSPAAPLSTSVLLPASTAKRLIAGMPKGRTAKNLPALSTVAVTALPGETPTAAVTDLSVPIVVALEDIGTFPNVDRVIPKRDRAAVDFVLTVDVLDVILKAARSAFDGAKTMPIRFSVPTSKGDRGGDKDGDVCTPIAVTVVGADVELEIVAMPFRGGSESRRYRTQDACKDAAEPAA